MAKIQENTEPIQVIDDSTYCSKVKIFIKQAIPSIMCMLFLRFQFFVTITFIGNLGDPTLLAGMGMANMMINVVVMSSSYGLNGALETLVTQAYGAGNLDLWGVYLNRSRLVLTIMFIPCMVFLLFNEQFLIACAQDEEASEAAQIYINYFLPGAYLTILNDAQRRFLNSLELSQIPFYLFLLGNVVQFGFCYLFISIFELSLKGAALACVASTVVIFLCMNIYTVCQTSIRAAVQWPDMRMFKGLKEYLSYGLPSAGLVVAEWWAFELIILMAGFLGVEEQAAQIILGTLADFFFQIPLGLQTAIATLIGQQIGKNDVPKAREYFRVSNHVSFSFIALTISLFVAFHKKIYSTMTNVHEIQQICINATLLITFFECTDMTQGFMQGQIKALGQQDRTVKFAIPIYWLVHVPLGWLFAITLKQEVQGFWMAGMVSTGSMGLAFWYLIKKTNWLTVASESQERTSQEPKDPELKPLSGKKKYKNLQEPEIPINEQADEYNGPQEPERNVAVGKKKYTHLPEQDSPESGNNLEDSHETPSPLEEQDSPAEIVSSEDDSNNRKINE